MKTDRKRYELSSAPLLESAGTFILRVCAHEVLTHACVCVSVYMCLHGKLEASKSSAFIADLGLSCHCFYLVALCMSLICTFRSDQLLSRLLGLIMSPLAEHSDAYHYQILQQVCASATCVQCSAVQCYKPNDSLQMQFDQP